MSMTRIRFLAFVLLGCCLATACGAGHALHAEGLLNGDYKGSNFEILLRDKGVATDTASLVKNLAEHANNEVREWCADVLGYRHETVGMDALRKAAERDKSWLVRESAYLALARLGDKSVLSALEDMMRSNEHGHKAFLAGQLAEFGDPVGYEYVRQAARSEASFERSYSAQYFSRFVPLRHDRRLSSDPFQELIALSGDREPNVRESALLCLARARFQGVDSVEVIAAIAAMAERETDPKLRKAEQDQIHNVEFTRDEAAHKRAPTPPKRRP